MLLTPHFRNIRVHNFNNEQKKENINKIEYKIHSLRHDRIISDLDIGSK